MINSLALGFRLLATRFELLILPIALSIVVFLMPPVDLTASMEGVDLLLEEIRTQTKTLGTAGQAADPQAAARLLALTADLDLSRLYVGDVLPLVGRTFFRLPAYVSSPDVQGRGPTPTWSITSLPEILVLMVSLILAGAMTGACHLYWLAQFVPNFRRDAETDTDETDDGREFMAHDSPPATMSRCLGQGMLYVGVLIALWFGTAFALSLLLTMLSLVTGLAILSNLMPFLMTLLVLAIVLFLFYQTYAAAGIMMDGLGVWKSLKQSLDLVRQNVLSTLAFLLLGGFILLGVQQMLELLVTVLQAHWIGILVAIVVFAYVGTAVSLAFLIFYRTRHLKNHGYDIAEYFALQDR